MTVLRYKGPIDFKPELQPNGKYAIRRVPIFECHTSSDPNYCKKVDAAWMYAAIRDQQDLKAKGFLPRVFVGHTDDSPGAKEKPVVCYLDNYAFDAADQWLYADYVEIEPEDREILKRFPGRSVEANKVTPAIRGLALLGGTPPYFKLPDVRFSEGEAIARYSVEIPPMPIDPKAAESNAQNPMAPEEKADYEKFCRYMAMYEASKAPAIPPVEPGKNPDDKTKEPESKEPSMADKKTDAEKFADAASTAKYAEVTAKYDALTVENRAMAVKIAALEEGAEKDAWRAKYAEARIPKERLNIEDCIGDILALPTERRQKYFDNTIRNVRGPSDKPVDRTDHATAAKPEPGSQAEAEAVKAKYQEWKTAGVVKTYAEAQAKYIKEIR